LKYRRCASISASNSPLREWALGQKRLGTLNESNQPATTLRFFDRRWFQRLGIPAFGHAANMRQNTRSLQQVYSAAVVPPSRGNLVLTLKTASLGFEPRHKSVVFMAAMFGQRLYPRSEIFHGLFTVAAQNFANGMQIGEMQEPHFPLCSV
jgi:hypothetical protein